VQLQSSTRRSTQTSCASDVKNWQDAQLAARRAIVQFCQDMQTVSPALPFLIANTKNVNTLAGKAWQNRAAGQGRGVVQHFSRRSRSRLLRVGARLKKDVFGVMATFTYRENMVDHAEAKQHLKLLTQWLQYHYKNTALLWRLEYQERGAIHFHILCLNINWVDAGAVTAYWQKLTGDDSYPDLKRLRSRRRVMAYISKYIAKMEQSEQASGMSDGFINVPYLQNFVGRFWGIVNRKCLPLAELEVMFVRGSFQLLNNLRRYARRKWGGLSRRVCGFSLFVNDSKQWMRLAQYELVRAVT